MEGRELFEQIEALSHAWPEQRGEPNLQDLPWLARALMDRLRITLTQAFPAPDDGVALVELVEKTLLVPSPSHVLRDNSPADLVHRCEALTREIRVQKLLPGDDASNFIAALLSWLGCISMAKTLRVVDSAGTVYTDALRRQGYELLETQWSERGGEWIRYGATLARALELGRGNHDLPDDWVPSDSPYWKR
jgi:hypothetical protein